MAGNLLSDLYGQLADPNDAFRLAQTYVLSQQYQHAEALLTNPDPFDIPRATTAKVNKWDDLQRGNMPLMGGFMITPQRAGTYLRLVGLSASCRYLAAQCSVCQLFPACELPHKIQARLGNWDEALEMLGEVNLFMGRENEPRTTIFALILLIRLVACVPQYFS